MECNSHNSGLLKKTIYWSENRPAHHVSLSAVVAMLDRAPLSSLMDQTVHWDAEAALPWMQPTSVPFATGNLQKMETK